MASKKLVTKKAAVTRGRKAGKTIGEIAGRAVARGSKLAAAAKEQAPVVAGAAAAHTVNATVFVSGGVENVVKHGAPAAWKSFKAAYTKARKA